MISYFIDKFIKFRANAKNITGVTGQTSKGWVLLDPRRAAKVTADSDP